MKSDCRQRGRQPGYAFWTAVWAFAAGALAPVLAAAAEGPESRMAAAADAAALPVAEPTTASAETGAGEPDLPSGGEGVPTLGGTQLWTDLVVFHGWRIQRHAFAGHCRLLDEQDRRQASGTFSACRARLEAEREARGMPPLAKRVVIVTHGLFGTRRFLHRMEAYLAQHGDFEVLTWGYASTRGTIEDHAEALAGVVRALEGVEEISFVAHSMGGLVVRCYLASGRQGELPDLRIRRLVMLGTPNQGSALARFWAERGGLFRLLAGPAAQQLSHKWEASAAGLAVPCCQFGILAGGRGDGFGWHHGIPGDDDGMVGVAETRLEGAADFRVLPLTHRTLMCDPEAMQCTLRFLEFGSFAGPSERDGR
ncbi:MAG: alpha/beta hydrolase [Pirellulales bacterium]|nr:alpha/beta hydrolase [Pirellulales bacterium]